MKINGNIIAHRGVHNNQEIPENSIKAFKRALDLNYPIELDVQLTKDNILVVFHDFNLTRMTNRTEYIQDMSYDELKKLTLLETREKIPTLSEVLQLVDGKVLLDIEIKNTERIAETCDSLVNELDEYKNFIIKSFNPKIVRYLKNNYPNIEVGLLITDKTNNKLYDLILNSKFAIRYAKPDFLAISKALLTNRKFKQLRKELPTLIWTINSKEEIDNTSNLIYICNNLPYKS